MPTADLRRERSIGYAARAMGNNKDAGVGAAANRRGAGLRGRKGVRTRAAAVANAEDATAFTQRAVKCQNYCSFAVRR